MTAAEQQRLRRHWAAELGCPAAFLESPGTYLIRSPQVPLNRFVLFSTGDAAVLQVSSLLQEPAAGAGKEAAAASSLLFGGSEQLAPAALSAAELVTRLERIPLTMAWTETFYCAGSDADLQRAVAGSSPAAAVAAAAVTVRLLRGNDAAKVAALVRGVDEREAFLAGVSGGQPPLFGALIGGELAAVACCNYQGGLVADLRVLTAAAHRGRGLATAAVAALHRGWLRGRFITQLRAPLAGRPVTALARRLGLTGLAVEEGMELLG